MTDLKRKVRRRTDVTVRDAGRRRRIVATLYPSGMLGLRLEKCRKEETIPLETCFTMAVRSRIARDKAERKIARKART